MNAVRTATLSDLRRRKLQTIIIAFVILLASGAATLALSLLVETDAPYDHAFAHARGAHLVITYDSRYVSSVGLRQRARSSEVQAFLGPLPAVGIDLTATGGGKGGMGMVGMHVMVAGRARPDTPMDRLTMEEGHWARSTSDIVLTQSLADSLGVGTGATVTLGDAQAQSFTVVGVAASISPVTDAWVLPQRVATLVSANAPLQYQMLYRVRRADTAGELRQATQTIAGHLSPRAVAGISTYLAVKRNADLTSAVMIPFLLAFSIFALVAAVLIIGNVVTGVVVAAYRDFGIMKSIGFTPTQVICVLLAQILTPVVAGCLLGIPLGTLAAQPFLQQTAHALNLPAPFTAVLPVDFLILAGVVVASILSVLSPAWRAGHMSAVEAISSGNAPQTGHATGPARHLSRLPLPRALTLGLGEALARPFRTATTLGSIVIGVATAVFAISLHLSLSQVAAHLIRDRYAQVSISRPAASQGVKPGAGLGGPVGTMSDASVTRLIRSQPGTARYVSEATAPISIPGLAEPLNYYAYKGASSWTGYALIHGRWFNRPGEVVAPTRLIQEAHLRIGDRFTAHMNGRPVRLRLVGEILDQNDSDLLLRGGWAAAASANPHLQATDYEIRLRAGTDPERYVQAVYQSAPGGPSSNLDVRAIERSSSNATFILFNGVIAGLALILIAIAVAGVFNTVVLTTRERVRDVAILKAIGMAPAQVVAMIITSVASIGLVAGVVGIPIGYTLHRVILQFMGRVASSTAIPPSFFDLIDHRALPLFVLAGMGIAALGAWIPAQVAASSGVADVLQSE